MADPRQPLSPRLRDYAAEPIISKAFTLVELLVSMAILSILLLVTLGIVNQTRRVWEQTSGMTSAFREARAAFETMTRRISQANLNIYFDYENSSGKTRAEVEGTGGVFVPAKYVRQSELHFVTGQASALLQGVTTIPAGAKLPGQAIFYQAPLGFAEAPPTGDAQLSNLLNAVGYFVQYSDDSAWRPEFLDTEVAPRTRYRLMQMVQGTEKLRVYAAPLTAANRFDWFTDSLDNNAVLARPFADNILTLVVWPRTSEEIENDRFLADTVTPLTADYSYDSKGYLADSAITLSRNQLPPQVQISLVAIDEVSAQRLEDITAGKQILDPGSLFTDSTPAQNFKDDMGALVNFLNENRLRHRVFTSTVVIRQAKFSKD